MKENMRKKKYSSGYDPYSGMWVVGIENEKGLFDEIEYSYPESYFAEEKAEELNKERNTQ